MPSIPSLLNRAFAPEQGFRARAAEEPALAEAFGRLLGFRTPPAFLALVLGYAAFRAFYGGLLRMEGPLFDYLWANLPESVNAADVRSAFQALPPLPPWNHVLPWFLLLAPLGVLSLWLHDAMWDHLGLWMLKGLKAPRTFRLSLVADAEALTVGVLGAALGLLANLPGAGYRVKILLLPVGIYFWVLRGFALAAWHGCPVWKGVVATLLHAFLALLLALGFLGGFLLLLFQALHP